MSGFILGNSADGAWNITWAVAGLTTKLYQPQHELHCTLILCLMLINDSTNSITSPAAFLIYNLWRCISVSQFLTYFQNVMVYCVPGTILQTQTWFYSTNTMTKCSYNYFFLETTHNTFSKQELQILIHAQLWLIFQGIVRLLL
jgi:hypothetical protein